MKKTFLALATTSLLSVGAFAAQSSGYHVTNFIAIGGDQDWDYIKADTENRRLYVSHGKQVEVLDLDSQKLVGTIPDCPGVHGIAIASDLGKGFTSNGEEGTSTIFDLKTQKTLGKVKVTGDDPDAIIYDPASKRVFTFNGDGKNSTAIDAATGKVVGTIDLGGGPEFDVADGAGHLYTNLEHEGQLVESDSRTLKILHRWNLHVQPLCSMAYDGKDRIFIGARDHHLLVVNKKNGEVVAKFPIGDHVDATVYDRGSGLIFSSCGEGLISVVKRESEDKYTQLEDIKTVEGAKTSTFDAKTGNLFLPCVKDNQYGVLVVGKE
jgi:DNA-binding beta-propeller fold protein YncE